MQRCLCLCGVCGGRASESLLSGTGWLWHTPCSVVAYVTFDDCVCGYVSLCSVTVMCICVWLPSCGCAAVVWLQAGNKLGAEGAKALAPELGKLTQLQTLNLRGE